MVPAAILAKIGIPVLAGVLTEALGKIDHPVAKSAAKALGELDTVLQAGQIAPSQMAEANRHAEAMATLKMKEYGVTLAEVNKSLRAETVSNDVYVRRMRPTFGYMMAFTWAAQMFGVAYIMVFRTAEAGAVMQGVESLSMIWAVGLSVLGVYVYKRSEEKSS